MNKRGVRISKALIIAQLVGFLMITVTGLIVHYVVLKIPTTVYAEIARFQEINGGNPQVSFTERYQDLSAIANREDWMLFTPLSFIVGGVAFGLVLTLKRKIQYVAKWSFSTGVIFSFIILALSFAGNYAEDLIAHANGYAMPSHLVTLRYAVMGTIQTAYWSVVFAGAGLLGALLRQKMQPSVIGGRTGNTVAAATGK